MSSSDVAPTTSTVSLTAPGWSVRSMRATCATCRVTPVRTIFENPRAFGGHGVLTGPKAGNDIEAGLVGLGLHG